MCPFRVSTTLQIYTKLTDAISSQGKAVLDTLF